MTGVLKEEKGTQRHTQRENLIKIEAETWVLCLQTKEHQLLTSPEAGREASNRFLSEPAEGPNLRTPDFRLWPPEL